MAVYYCNLLLILGLAYPLCIHKPTKAKKIAYVVITFGYMWFLATFRYNIGFDYNVYIRLFAEINAAPTFADMMSVKLEWGYILLNKLIGMFTTDPTVMYGVFAFLILAPIAWFVYKYCEDAWISTWLYVTLAFFYNSMNFVRQCMACGIIAMSYGFMKERKTIPFLLMVVLAAFFHKSALLMIPVYFLTMIKLDKKMAIFYASATVLLYLTSEWVLDIATDYVFTYYKGTVFIDPAAGFPITFLIIPFAMFGACLALRPIWLKRDKDAPLLFYMALFSAIIWLFITRHFIIERFSLFVYIFMLVATPAALSCLKASPEDYAELARLREEQGKGKGGKGKEAQAKLKALQQKVKDHQKYYGSAVAALLLLTAIYNDFGANVNNFHGVFPYQSVIQWLNTIG